MVKHNDFNENLSSDNSMMEAIIEKKKKRLHYQYQSQYVFTKKITTWWRAKKPVL